MIFEEGMLLVLGMTPMGAGLHDPPAELRWEINRVSRGDE